MYCFRDQIRSDPPTSIEFTPFPLRESSPFPITISLLSHSSHFDVLIDPCTFLTFVTIARTFDLAQAPRLIWTVDDFSHVTIPTRKLVG